MQWLNNMKIRAKLMTMMSVPVALSVIVGGYSIAQLAAVNAAGSEIADRWLPSVQTIGHVHESSRQFQSLQYQFVSQSDPAALKDLEKRLETTMADIVAGKAAYAKFIDEAEERASYDRMEAAWTRYAAVWPTARDLAQSGKRDEAVAVLVAAVDDYRVMDSELDALVKFNADGSAAANRRGDALYAQAKLLILVALTLACALGVTLALVISGRITKTVLALHERIQSLSRVCISGTRDALTAMAKGDFSVSVTPKTQPLNSTDRDEFGEIARGVDGIIIDVKETIAAFTETQHTIRGLITDAQTLVAAAQRGNLSERANVEAQHGAFRELVEGLNGTLAAVEAPIREANTVLGRLAERDLTSRMSGTYHGNYAEMQRSINHAIENLETTLTQVALASDQVSSAGTQITAGGQSLASGSSQQAASLEEVSASVQEFAMMAKQSAENARDAQQLATEAQSNATDGTARMERLTQAVNEIKQSSVETAKIMKSIEEIAFQTNLLALNAAVEAARAGDAGRGFAVVADEVRALAIRSADASKSTAELIERGLASAERGVALNAEVSQSFGRINQQVSRVADVMSDIASAASQQSSGVTQINAALEQLNAVTQQVAANAEESASAAEELESQARSLNDTVAAFKLASTAATAANRRQAAPSRPATPRGRAPQPVAAFAGAGYGDASDSDDEVFLGF